ncbi:MAG: hypothetical protein ACI95C_000004 [Pseudohongiellaceae bacterium]|jgi:hypothetical protein
MLRFLWAAVFQTLAVNAYAQSGDIEDVGSIDGIINAYYEVVSGPAGETVDVSRDRFIHHPNAWVSIAGKDSNNAPTVTVMTLSDYHGENSPRSQGFYEKEVGRVVSRSGNMVHVWSSYTSALTENGTPYTRGVNSITLFFDDQRWWIMGWMFDDSAQ